MFLIEDKIHCELIGDGYFQTYEDAMNKLVELSHIPWNEEPNLPPCINWENCKRVYSLIEGEGEFETWVQLSRIPMLKISSKGVEWINN